MRLTVLAAAVVVLFLAFCAFVSMGCGASPKAQVVTSKIEKFTRIAPPALQAVYTHALIACDDDPDPPKCEIDTTTAFAPLWEAFELVDELCDEVPAICKEAP